MASEGKKLHAIIIPLPHQGHINPAIDLALKLASHGFGITFVSLEFAHHQMMSKAGGTEEEDDDDIFSGARKSGLDIRHATVSDGFPLEFDRVLYLDDFWESMLINFQPRIDELVGRIVGADPDLTHFMITDTLFAWPAAVAKKYNLVNVSFWTEPAIVFSLIFHCELLREKGHFPCKDNIEEEINYIPGIESINTKDFMPYLRESGVKTRSYKVVHSAYKEVHKADIILHNTVYELESKKLSALNNYQPHYAIGPICFSKNLPISTVRKSLSPETDCTKWLSSKPRGSVLYVSFGSLVQTNRQNIEEIAYGILLSGVKFVWVVRAGVAGDVDASVLPDGFENEIQDKGLVIPWCNQIKVLSDPAVGGFVTHCGWNSTLESVWFGVPMICYPLDYDQPTNRKLIVEDWKVGVNLFDTSRDRKEVAEKIRSVVSEPASKGLHQNLTAVREKLMSAVEVGGSSERNFEKFILDLEAKIDSKK